MRTGPRAGRTAVTAVAVAAVVLAAWLAVPAGATTDAPDAVDDTDVGGLLRRAQAATASPHAGMVTVVSFTGSGPRVAELAVTVADGEAVLERPARVLVGPAVDGALAADVEDDVGGDARRLPTSTLGLDVGAILSGWDVTLGRRVVLDTGPATPVHLVRATGAAVRETLFVDDATELLVRRETRTADGRVLRVVAYTELTSPPDATAPSPSSGPQIAARTGWPTGLVEAREAGYEVTPSLSDGFDLVAVELDEDMVVARYGDGLSVLSVYQLHGALDPDALDTAEVRHVAGRDVWTWPGLEPVRYAWTSDDRTWITVSDAPAPVIEGALRSLPGELVGHDAPHRLRRGLDRVWQFVTSPLR